MDGHVFNPDGFSAPERRSDECSAAMDRAYARRCERIALAFMLAVGVAQILFVTVGCDWDLCGDEAEYWAWSRRLDWGYYAKGPLIALIIRISTTLCGPLSLAITGSTMLAVRLPALVLGGLTAWGLYRLTSETTGSPKAGLIAVLLLPAIPLFRVGSLILTVDTPLICCWTWSAVWAYRGIIRQETHAWVIAGSIAAVGVLAKYTMIALPASVGLFLLAQRTYRRQIFRPGFWLMSLTCVLGISEIILWNAAHRWVGLDQIAHRLGLLPSDELVDPVISGVSTRWSAFVSVLGFLGSEVAVLGIWWLVGVCALWRAAPVIARSLRSRFERPPSAREAPAARDIGLSFLASLWLVVWVACFVVSLLGESEANWAAPAHLALVALMAWWLADRVHQPLPRRWFVAVWAFSLTFLSAVQHTEWFYPLFRGWVPGPTAARPAPLRRLEPTCRMRGYRELAPAVEARLASLRAQGLDPFVLVPTYTLASTLSFYLPGQPEVYCISWSPGLPLRAVNQHDLWRPNPRFDWQAFEHRPAVIVEDANVNASYAQGVTKTGTFVRVDGTERFVAKRSGLVVGAWDVSTCSDFRGLPAARIAAALAAARESAGR
jgi:hypothetical protein